MKVYLSNPILLFIVISMNTEVNMIFTFKLFLLIEGFMFVFRFVTRVFMMFVLACVIHFFGVVIGMTRARAIQFIFRGKLELGSKIENMFIIMFTI